MLLLQCMSLNVTIIWKYIIIFAICNTKWIFCLMDNDNDEDFLKNTNINQNLISNPITKSNINIIK